LALIKKVDNMKTISTNELVHFTEFKYLKSILTKKAFYPRFNLEILLMNPNLEKKASIFPIPMVCFCDIPLNLTETHRERYGNCAIALKEDWKTRKKINPVFYIKPESQVANTLSDITNSLEKLFPYIHSENTELATELSKLRNNFMTIIHYGQNYENKDIKSYGFGIGETLQEKRKFYDEKEWRYIPEHSENRKDLELCMHDFKVPALLDQANKKLEKYELNFENTDIDFLIVNSINEKKELEIILNKLYETNIEIKIIKRVK
jgi:hypothetical protein